MAAAGSPARSSSSTARARRRTPRIAVRGLRVTGTQQGLILWGPTLHDITFDNVVITGALTYGVRYETVGSTDILLSNVTSADPASPGSGAARDRIRPGITFDNVSLR